MGIYQIQQGLLDLFNHIEENGGEITEAQEHYLEIKQEELANKLDAYRKAIIEWNNDVAYCKDEEKRIATRRKVYENRAKRLKSVMLNAVSHFGDVTKNGVKFVELSTARLSVRTTQATVVDEHRAEILIKAYRDVMKELYEHGLIGVDGDEVDLEGLLDVINANCVAEYGDDFELFSYGDLFIKMQVSTKVSIADSMKSTEVAALVNKYPFDAEITMNTSKEELKKDIIRYDDTSRITIAKVVQNESLTIK